ncbi:hypothetical protein AB4114_11170 [Paenibacillus sp. 2RAB27]|uniref:hypothetical protein n=1 Tax=Paenibacillus sp. 2RAB27 TaxID=3232991 RepID=UPI003F9650F8
MADKNYIRKPAVFNPGSAREKRIWDWIESSTNNFKGQNFAAFVRDKLEWCMQNEGGHFTPAVIQQPITQDSKQGYSKLL